MYSLFTTFTSNFLHDFSLKLPLNRELKTLTFKIISENCVLFAVFFFLFVFLVLRLCFCRHLLFFPCNSCIGLFLVSVWHAASKIGGHVCACVYIKIIIKKREHQGTWSSCRGSKMGGNDKNIVFMYAFLNKIELKTLSM